MKHLPSKLGSVVLAFAVAATTIAPAMSAPVYAPNVPAVSSDVIQVASRNNRNHFERRGNDAYFNGKRGYRSYHRGYKRYNGFWFPAGAFIAGALITGAIVNNRAHNTGSAHVQWCYDRWHSYRASDNTYQPTRGPRQQCNSPYN